MAEPPTTPSRGQSVDFSNVHDLLLWTRAPVHCLGLRTLACPRHQIGGRGQVVDRRNPRLFFLFHNLKREREGKLVGPSGEVLSAFFRRCGGQGILAQIEQAGDDEVREGPPWISVEWWGRASEVQRWREMRRSTISNLLELCRTSYLNSNPLDARRAAQRQLALVRKTRPDPTKDLP